jgi:hypothetical protein
MIIYNIPIPSAPGIDWTNMPSRKDITGFGDIPLRAEFAEPVFVEIETVLKNSLPKLPNLVSKPVGPLT